MSDLHKRLAEARTDYALFHEGRQISKPHSTKVAAVIEAFERGVVIRCGRVYEMTCGYEVKPISEKDDGATS